MSSRLIEEDHINDIASYGSFSQFDKSFLFKPQFEPRKMRLSEDYFLKTRICLLATDVNISGFLGAHEVSRAGCWSSTILFLCVESLAIFS